MSAATDGKVERSDCCWASAWAPRTTSKTAAPFTIDELDHDHDDFDLFVVPVGEIADPAQLAARVAALAEKFDVLRVKGFAAVAGKPLRLLLQAVGSA